MAFLVLDLVLGRHQTEKQLLTQQRVPYQLNVCYDFFSLGNSRVHCLYKCGNDFFLRDMRGFAFPVPIEFMVTAIYNPAVLVIGMPDLGTVPASALCTFYLVGENADPTVHCRAFLGAFGKFHLHQIINTRLDDGFVIASRIILGNISHVFLGLFLNIIHCEFLLEQSIAFALLTGKHPTYCCSTPLCSTRSCQFTIRSHYMRYGVGYISFQKLTSFLNSTFASISEFIYASL